MDILLIKHFCVGFTVSEIPRVYVFGYFALHVLIVSRYVGVCRSVSVYCSIEQSHITIDWID